MWAKRALVGLVVLSMALVACGGDDDDDAGGDTGGETPANTLTVTEVDYGYELEGEPEAGTVTFAMENTGEEIHMIAVCKVKGDASITEVTDAAQADEESAFGEVCEEQSGIDGAGGIQAPGTAYEVTVTDVEEGRYVAMCFIPDAEGTPHLALGMAEEFEVGPGDVTEEPEADVTYTADADGTEGPEELDAGRTTFQVDAEDISREVVLVKVKDGNTPADVDEYFEQLDESPVFDPAEAPVEFLGVAFDWEDPRWFTVDLTEGLWGIGVPDPDDEQTLPAEEDPHVVLFEVT